MHKGFLQAAMLMGSLSVALGAFAAHGLKKTFSPQELAIFETAVRYQFYHVFALIAAAMLYKNFPGNLTVWSGRLFLIGIVLFSGSLYLLSYSQSIGLTQLTWLGAITPFGGTAFIAGWICLFLSVSKKS